MATYNVLNWKNENALSNYPLAEALEVQDFLVDAKFVQFDGFVPILNYIKIDYDRIKLTVTFDYGENTAIELLKSVYDRAELEHSVRIYTPDASRCLGMLTFGAGAQTLWQNYGGRVLTINKAFLADTVRSIPSQDAVYLLDGSYGDVLLTRTQNDSTIFYNTSTTANAVVFNAVGGHSVPEAAKPIGLRKINLVLPQDNNINLASNDVIKLNSFNSQSLTISLVSGSPATAFAIPTLIA